MPVPGIWGPPAWRILHAIGSRAGKALPALVIDERRELLWLIEHIENFLPCPECRQHTEKYRRSVGLPGTSSDAAEWLWNFHEAVNRRLEKSPGPALSDVKDAYSSVNISQAWKEYRALVKDSIIQGHLSGAAFLEFGRHLRLWRSFAG